ncbi:unnamed protein product [Caenorhabditis angaria]|uniref:F-box domain-containing protein n=1 Tax=Caenorhabditis angaria TaxID=860376 RepID=A0A9P1IHQ5_9PELO|nr:unnamed protein product [Caenorhabditis angaria]
MENFDFFADFSINEDEPATSSRHGKCKTFEDWPKLPYKIKKIIISNLGFKCRLNLSLCSKSDFENVKNSKMKISEIRIVEQNLIFYEICKEEEKKCSTVEIYFDIEKGERFEMNFVEENEKCVLISIYDKSYKRKRKFSQICENNYKIEAMKLVEFCLAKCDYRLKRLTIEMEQNCFVLSPIPQLQNLRNLRVVTENQELLLWWIRKVGPPKLKTLQICTKQELPTAFLNEISTQLNSCDKLYFWATPLFNQQQFLNLNAKVINLDVGLSLTDETINILLQKWANGEIRKDFVQFLGWFKRDSYDKDIILKNLKVKKWDEQFYDESQGFCFDFERYAGKGDCYEVENNHWKDISATLLLSSDRITFLVTGRLFHGRMSHFVPVA